jgi:16S rRNA (guanine966-N2)-methyltransferase
MRIIGGEFRSRRLLTPRDANTTRPIPDRVKESLFGLLRGHTEDAQIFDAFAGTGAIGLEALGRGAAHCVFVERDRQIADILRQNVEAMELQDRCEIVVGDALGPGALARCPHPVNLIFMDPPYALARDVLGWKRIRMQLERLIGLLTDDGFAVLRTPWPFMLIPSAALKEEEAVANEPVRTRRGGRGRGVSALARHGAQAHEQNEESPECDPGSLGSITPELSFEHADGPETHVYNTTAVHLYARRRDAKTH